MKVAFVLTVHYPDDERVWFQEVQSLQKSGCETFVISTRTNYSSLPNTYCFDDKNISKRDLIEKISATLSAIIPPDYIICDNPIAILAAKHYKKQKQIQIIYDITEWYPSKKNLKNIPLIDKIAKFFSLLFLSSYAAIITDKFIFGEYYKAQPFRLFLPKKKYIYLPYYADVNKVKTYPIKDISKECVFFYAGHLNKEKGFKNVLNAVLISSIQFPETKFIFRIISHNQYFHLEKQLPKNLEIQKLSPLSFPSFCIEIGKADIFFDLRTIDIENTHCLPIKIFYYMAAGRPVIYSDLKAIRKDIPEISKIGILVNPKDTHTITTYISHCLKDKDYYQNQCKYARLLSEQKYNWANIEQVLVDFICNHSKNTIPF